MDGLVAQLGSLCRAQGAESLAPEETGQVGPGTAGTPGDPKRRDDRIDPIVCEQREIGPKDVGQSSWGWVRTNVSCLLHLIQCFKGGEGSFRFPTGEEGQYPGHKKDDETQMSKRWKINWAKPPFFPCPRRLFANFRE